LTRQFQLAETVASLSSAVSLTTCLILILFASAAFSSQSMATMMVWRKIRDLWLVDCPQAEPMVARASTIAAKVLAVTESDAAWPRPILERVARSQAYLVWPAELTDWKARVLASSARASQVAQMVHRGSVAALLALAMVALPVDRV
jgi:hypothetical protein